jgi:hypothetical protein
MSSNDTAKTKGKKKNLAKNYTVTTKTKAYMKGHFN